MTVVKYLPAEPDRATAKQQVGQFMSELLDLWMEHHGQFIAGKTFYFLGFRPDDYAPAQSGVVKQPNPFERSGGGTVPYAFAVSDDPKDEKARQCLWKIKPDPKFFPDGVSGP